MADSGDGPAKRAVTRREAWKLGGAAAGALAGFEVLAGKGGRRLSSRPGAFDAAVEPQPGIADWAEPLGHHRLSHLRDRNRPVAGQHRHESGDPPDRPAIADQL